MKHALAWLVLLGSIAHADEKPLWQRNRAWITLRPYFAYGVPLASGTSQQDRVSGLVADLGVEASLRNGFQLGFEIAPAAFYSYVRTPSLTARIKLGYTSETLAIGFGLASGLTFLFPQFGPLIRIGRLDRTYVEARITWSLYPPLPAPVDADLMLSVPLHRRVRLRIEGGGGYGNLLGFWGLGGAQVRLYDRHGTESTLIGAGVGATWLQFTAGPMFLATAERRF